MLLNVFHYVIGRPFKPCGCLVPSLSHQSSSRSFLIVVASALSGILSIVKAFKSLEMEWPGSLKCTAMGVCFLFRIQDLWSVNLSDRHLLVSPVYCLLHFPQ